MAASESASSDGRELLKFPRTQHLFSAGDGGVSRDDLIMDKATAELFYTPRVPNPRKPVNVVLEVEEKVDGANLGISIGEDGKIRAQNRSHFINSSTHKQFSALDSWIEAHRAVLYDLLQPNNDVLYGEWLAVKHSIHYTNLPDLFLAFDIFDSRAQLFCSRRERDRRLEGTGIHTVRLIHSGPVNSKEQMLEFLEQRSAFYDGPVEGVYLRVDEDAPNTTAMQLPEMDGLSRPSEKSRGRKRLPPRREEAGPWGRIRAKLVRPDFIQAIEEQWTRQKLVKNIVTYA